MRPKREHEEIALRKPDTKRGNVDIRPRRFGKLALASAYAVVGLLIVTPIAIGVGSHLFADNTPKKTTVPTAEPTVSPVMPLGAAAASAALENFHSPISACDPEFDLYLNSDKELQDKDAQACLDVETDVKVAFVNYDLPALEAKTLASDIASIYNDRAGDSIHVEVDAIPASEEAKALFKQETPDGCVEAADDSDITDFPSYDAAVTMSGLKTYNKVIAETDDKACGKNSHELGAAIEADGVSKGSNRYAALFNMRSWFSEDTIASAGAHELGHLFGLGHSGTLTAIDGVNLANLVQNSSATASTTLNLDEYIAAGKYSEYAGHTMMGDVYGDLKRKDNLNVAQKYFLDWPDRVLDEPSSVNVTDLDSTTATFNNDTSSRSIAILKLKQFLIMPDQSDTSAEYQDQQFNEIAFVPEFKNDALVGVRVYMLSTKDSTVYLGRLNNTVDLVPAKYVLSIGGKLVEVTMNQVTHTAVIEQPQYSLK